MSLLSLANDLPETKQEFDLSSLSAAFVKALILRDDADGKDESGSVDNITDSQWALYTRKFNAQTQSLLQNSGHPTTASRALTVPQVDALAGSRSRGRRILSQNSNFERVESEDEAKMRIRKAWDLFTDPAQDFWIEHQRAALADGKDVLTELSDLRHMQSIFDSFTRVDAEAFERCLIQSKHTDPTSVASLTPRDISTLIIWNRVRDIWAASLRSDLRASLGIDIRTLSQDQRIAVLKSLEGVRAAHYSCGSALPTVVDVAKLVRSRSTSSNEGSDLPMSTSAMVEAKFAEMEELTVAGKLSSYVQQTLSV